MTLLFGLAVLFQSTPSVGRATRLWSMQSFIRCDFNPRPPWGGRPPNFTLFFPAFSFQSTPSVGRATSPQRTPSSTRSAFQSTPSVGRATSHLLPSARMWCISIHALRGEGDQYPTIPRLRTGRFQSTPSVGRATKSSASTLIGSAFQSTPSVGRATESVRVLLHPPRISIHALRGEGDKSQSQARQKPKNFNPRPPWGGRQASATRRENREAISIHALRGEGDRYSSNGYNGTYKFQSTPSVGRATRQPLSATAIPRYFNPRPPWGGRQIAVLQSGKKTDYFNPRPPWGGRRR